MAQKIIGLLFGTGFGFMLCWLGFTQYDTIFNALLLQDFYLWEVFCTAVLTGTIGLWALRLTGARTWTTGQPVSWDRTSVSTDQWIGGALFGLGWVLSGTCPGPAIARIGTGQWVGLFTLAGIFVGIYVCDHWESGRANISAALLRARNEAG